MHRFHPSRARILFEVFCAMTLAASFAVAWTQTGASALLPAAAVAVLYSIVRTFDLRHHSPVVVAATDTGRQADTPAATAEVEVEVCPAVKEETAAAKPKRRSRKKPAAPEPAAVAESVEMASPEAEPEARVEFVDQGPDEVEFDDERPSAPVPLFEPEPFVRQQRTVFGRKAG